MFWGPYYCIYFPLSEILAPNASILFYSFPFVINKVMWISGERSTASYNLFFLSLLNEFHVNMANGYAIDWTVSNGPFSVYSLFFFFWLSFLLSFIFGWLILLIFCMNICCIWMDALTLPHIYFRIKINDYSMIWLHNYD